MKNIRRFYLKVFHFLVVKVSVYLNRCVLVMKKKMNLMRVRVTKLLWLLKIPFDVFDDNVKQTYNAASERVYP